MKVGVARALALITLGTQSAMAVGVADSNLLHAPLVADQPVLIRFDRLPEADEGRLAFLVDRTDATALVRVQHDGSVAVATDLLRLAPGEHELTVYLVRSGRWEQVSTLRFLVLARERGSDALQGRASLHIASQSKYVANGDMPPPPRATFLDSNVRAGVGAQFPLGTAWAVRATAHLSGSSHRAQALQYAQRGEEADKLDLSDYRIELAGEPGGLQVGHVQLGRHPLLLTQFTSRGAAGVLRLGPQLDVSMGAANGNAIVGFDDFFGLYKEEHRVVHGSAGFEFDPSRPGWLRAELSVTDGATRPRSSFGQGSVPESERTRGTGLRLTGGLFDRRLRLDMSWARSLHEAQADDQLAGGYPILSLPAEHKNAHAVDLSFDVLRSSLLLGERWPIHITLSARHDRLDPLYRTTGLPLQADLQQWRWGLQAQVGPTAWQISLVERQDNLDDVTSLPVFEGRTLQLSTSWPLAQVAAGGTGMPSPWWPHLTITLERNAHRPVRDPQPATDHDQHNVALSHPLVRRQQLSLAWAGPSWTANYIMSVTRQTDLGAGGSDSNYATRQHHAATSFDPWPWLRFNGAWTRHSHTLTGLQITSTGESADVGFDWRFLLAWSLVGKYGIHRSNDSEGIQQERSLASSTQLARRFTFKAQGARLDGQWFVRHSMQSRRAQHHGYGQRTAGREWTINLGLGVSFQ